MLQDLWLTVMRRGIGTEMLLIVTEITVNMLLYISIVITVDAGIINIIIHGTGN